MLIRTESTVRMSLNILKLSKKCHKVDYKAAGLSNHAVNFYHKKSNLEEYARCYKILEIPDGSDQECVRKAFIDLCKKYHPDSGKSSANALKFQEIDHAYKTLQNKFAEERWNINEGIGEYGLYYKEKKKEDLNEKPKVFDIKHTAPQHRHYLSYDGFGLGTPSQREKQYCKRRTVVAAENVYEHQIKKLSEKSDNAELISIAKTNTEAKKIKTRYGMERLVEDLIQESMQKGHFDNLKGQGKPLPSSNYNPYVDFVTHKMNKILIDNGFTPEWITLQKEISDEIESLRDELKSKRRKLGPLPLNFSEEEKWNQTTDSLKIKVQKLNQKINKYNLLVPLLQKQKLYFDLKKESCDILNCENYNIEYSIKENSERKETSTDLLNSLFSVFSR